MSVLIKGMKMPKSCLLCPFGDEFGKCCVNAELEDANELTHSCPLIELPDHGDLIDRDALFDDISWDWFDEWGNLVNKQAELVADAPVVIPADWSEDGET